MLTTTTSALPTTAAHVLEARGLSDKVVAFATSDPRARPFNLLRTQVARFAAAGTRRIAVTSPAPEVGKTFIASNLAASLSRLPELKTFLFDFDLRRGSVAETFGMKPEQGMTEFLAGKVDDLGAIAWEIEGQALTVFPTSGANVASSELLATHTFVNLAAAMDGHPGSAVFVCDLPPAFANDDAMIAAEHMDGYLLVVEDGVTTVRQVEDAIRLLGRDKLLGTVLNRYVRGLGSDDYGYGYGHSEKKYAKYYAK